MDNIIALDVGGTSIEAGIVKENGQLLEETLEKYPSNAKSTKQIILNHLFDIIETQANKVTSNDEKIKTIAMGFPGPFDYEEGISLIQGIDKYDEIYGVNLRTEIKEHIESNSLLKNKFLDDYQVVFENDASLFALGEVVFGRAKRFNKCICICLGTGIGSAFIENKVLLKDRWDVPDNGWVYNHKFKDTIADDYISARGILNIAKEVGIEIEGLTVKDLAKGAREGRKRNIQVFHCFGEMLATVILPHLVKFKPEGLVIGGNISKSYDLFKDSFEEIISSYKVSVEISSNSHNTLIGTAAL